MIKITQLKLPIRHTEEDIRLAAAKILKIKADKIKEFIIVKKSIDARKGEVKYIYNVELTLQPDKNESEKSIIDRCASPQISVTEKKSYSFTPSGTESLKHRPVIVGTGPAGLFAALMLARHCFQPLVIERGYEIGRRVKAVEHF